MMTKRGSKNAGAKAHRDPLSKWGYVPPWLLPFVLLAGGSLLHNHLAAPEWVLPITVIFLYTATAAVAVTTWLYAQARGPIIQWHSTGTVIAGGLTLVLAAIFGLHPGLVWPTVGVGVAFAVTWNIRRLEVIRGEGNDAHNKEVLAELGLTVKRKTTVTDGDERKEVKLKLGDGQTAEDVQKVIANIGSHAGTIRNGVRATPGEYEGEVTLSMSFKDVLRDTVKWPGPTHPGGSIADGIRLGIYEDGQEVWFYPAGNYKKNIAPGHLAIAGLSGTGKGVLARIIITELSTRRDVLITGSDTRKGDQFQGPLRGALDWWVLTEPGVKGQLKAIERAMDARNAALGKAGYDSWTPDAFDDPRLRMPANVHWLEEAAAVLDDNPRVVVELGEACRSSGIYLAFSAQRWSNDRMPTSLRYNIANAVCYGVGDEVSASMVLSDSTLKAGPDPYEWRARFPGRALLEGNGIDIDRFPVPWKTYFLDRGPAADVIAEWAHVRPPRDGVTAAAFGDVYEQRAKPAARIVVQRTAADEFDPESDDDDEFVDYGEEEEKYMIPAQPDPEMAANVNPREELPAYEGPENDLSPEPAPGERKLTPEQRRQAFGEMIAALMDAQRCDVTMAELVDAWEEKVGPSQANQRPFLHEQLKTWIELGQIERVPEGRGKYRLLAAATVGAHSP